MGGEDIITTGKDLDLTLAEGDIEDIHQSIIHDIGEGRKNGKVLRIQEEVHSQDQRKEGSQSRKVSREGAVDIEEGD